MTNYGGLLATRFFLGLFECGMVPGCFYLLGMWYKRDEAQTRFTLFFASTALAGAFGGLLAAGIGKMDDVVPGYSGWRWIFILEGVLTCVVALVFWFFFFPSFVEEAVCFLFYFSHHLSTSLPLSSGVDLPLQPPRSSLLTNLCGTQKWLTEEEREYVKARLHADQGASAAERAITLADIKKVMSDYKVWIGGLIYFALVVPAYGYAFFSPTIIQTYRYSPIETQLRSVPPYAAAFGFAMAVAVVSDTIRHRFLFVIGGMLISLTGLGMLYSIHDNVNTQYGALFLVAIGLYAAMPIAVCWFNMNLVGHHRRSIGIGWQIGFGNIGGIISTYSFLRDDAPLFKKGYIICISFVCLGLISAASYAAAVAWENRKRDLAVGAVELSEEEKTVLGVSAIQRKSSLVTDTSQDLNPEFRYMM